VHALPGGSRYELKWDGYRMASIRSGDGVRLWSRQGKDLTDRFPDVQAALQAQLDIDCVLDGEIVVWTGEKLDFGQLQLRLVTSPAESWSTCFSRLSRPLALAIVDMSPRRRPGRRGRRPSGEPVIGSTGPDSARWPWPRWG
jgi:hypothetical protein